MDLRQVVSLLVMVVALVVAGGMLQGQLLASAQTICQYNCVGDPVECARDNPCPTSPPAVEDPPLPDGGEEPVAPVSDVEDTRTFTESGLPDPTDDTAVPEGTVMKCDASGGLYLKQDGRKRYYSGPAWTMDDSRTAVLSVDCAALKLMLNGPDMPEPVTPPSSSSYSSPSSSSAVRRAILTTATMWAAVLCGAMTALVVA